MNSLIETVIAQILSPYLEGISRENLRLGILAGNVRLENLRVKPSIFDRLNLPQLVLESALVTLVNVSLRGSKIDITVSGVSARVRYNSVLDRDTQVRLKRDAVDAIKASLAVSSESRWGSLAARLARKILASLIVTVTDIEISAILSPVQPELDDDGFADATSVKDESCEIRMGIEKIEILEENFTQEFILSKTLHISKLSLAVLPESVSVDFDLITVLPATDLSLRLDQTVGGQLRLHVSGLEGCDVVLKRAQLVLLKDALLVGSSDLSATELVPMEPEMALNYAKLYAEGREDLSDLLFIFEAKSIAVCELGVDVETGKTPPPTPKWNFWSAEESTQLVRELEQQEQDLVDHFWVKIDIGQNWRVRLFHDHEQRSLNNPGLLDIRLHGASVLATRGLSESSLTVESKGVTVLFDQQPLLALQADSQGTPPVVVRLHHETALQVSAVVRPMALTYLPGLVRQCTEYFSFLADPLVASSIEVRRAQASELFQFSTKQLVPSSIGFDLCIAGPIISLPRVDDGQVSPLGSRVVLTLGEIRVSVPKSVFDGSVDTPVGTATLERFSVTAITESFESVQIVAPTPVEFSGFYNHVDQLIDFTLAMDQVLSCRISPQAVRVFIKTFQILSNEFPKSQPILVNSPVPTMNNFKMVLSARIERIDLMVSDGSTDELNFQVALPAVNLSFSPDAVFGACDEIRVLARCLNSRVGDWEPLIEPSFYSFFFKMDSIEISAKFRALSSTNLVLSSETVRTVGWLSSALQRVSTEDRYRVVNASSVPVFICVQGVDPKDCMLEIGSSSDSVPIDGLILPHGARELVISANRALLLTSDATFGEAKESGESEMLRVPLNRFHSALLTCESSFLMVQSMATESDYRVVLVSHNAFVFNECDVPLVLKGWSSALPTPDSVWTAINSDQQHSNTVATFTTGVVLNPGCFVSVAFANLSFSLQTTDSTADAGGPMFTFDSPTVLPAMFDSKIQDLFHVRIDCEFGESSLPLAARIYNVFLRPPLRVRNFLPRAISMRFAQSLTATVAAWQTLCLHSFPPSTDVGTLRLRVGFANSQTEWSPELYPKAGEGVLEERHFVAPDPDEAAAELTCKSWAAGRCFSVGVKWWLVDRTGWKLTVLQEGSELRVPTSDEGCPIFLLPDPDKPVLLSVCLGVDHCELALPDSGWTLAQIGPRLPVVFVSKETFLDKYVEIIPRYTIFNALERDTVWLSDDNILPPGLGTTWHADFVSFGIGAGHCKSAKIPLNESSAGIWPVHVDGAGKVVRIEIAPVNGSINLTIREGSSITVRNEKRHKDVVIEVDRGQVFRVPPLSEKCIGWTDPFSSSVCEAVMHIGGKSFTVPLTKARDNIRYGGSVRIDPGDAPQSIVLVVEHKADDLLSLSRRMQISRGKTLLGLSDSMREEILSNENIAKSRTIRLEFHANAIGLSVVRSGKELIYVELSLIRSLILQDQFVRRVSMLVSDIQVDTGVSAKPVVLVNNGTGIKPFIEALLETSLQVSKGVVVVPTVDIQFDNLFVEVDSAFMSAMDEFLNELMGTEIGLGSTMTGIKSRDLIASLTPIMRGTVRSIPVPSILVLDSLQVSQVEISLWVDFALNSMLFMPSSLKLVIGLLSLGGSFRLEGSNIGFKRRQVANFKGTGIHFAQSMIQEYGNEALKNIAALLGSSSLLAIPRAPIELMAGIGGFGLESATKAVGAFGNKIADFASDAKYREAQAKIRKSKKIKGFADGFVESANRLGEGAEGILDIFKKPVLGAQTGGVGGFFVGIGSGLVGTFVKPITKFGEAIGDMGTGIARSVQSAKSGKPKFSRRRLPRPFYGRANAVMQYREVDAFLYQALPKTQIGGFELVLPILTGVPLLHRSDLKLINADSFNESAEAASSEEIISNLVLFETKLMAVKIHKFVPSFQLEREPSPTISLSPRSQSSAPESPTTGPPPTATYSEATIVREVYLRQIRDAYVSIPTRSINISDMFGGKAQFFLDLPASSNAGALLASIANTVAAGVGKGAFDWRETKRLFADAKLEEQDGAMSTAEGGKRCEVVEVERFLMTYGWRTPYLMLDTNTGWRWVDNNMKRHSKIRQKIRRSEAAKAKIPPIDFGDLWTPVDEWKVLVDPENTDKDGWQYALSFNSSTWQRHSGITASVRKRTWVRNYR